MADEEFLEGVFEEVNLAVGLNEFFHGRPEGLVILARHSSQGGNRQIDQCEFLGGTQSARSLDHFQNLAAHRRIEVLEGLVVVGD